MADVEAFQQKCMKVQIEVTEVDRKNYRRWQPLRRCRCFFYVFKTCWFREIRVTKHNKDWFSFALCGKKLIKQLQQLRRITDSSQVCPAKWFVCLTSNWILYTVLFLLAKPGGLGMDDIWRWHQRMYFWCNKCILYLLTCQMIVAICDSGLCQVIVTTGNSGLCQVTVVKVAIGDSGLCQVIVTIGDSDLCQVIVVKVAIGDSGLSVDQNHRWFRSLSDNSCHRWFRPLSDDSNHRWFRYLSGNSSNSHHRRYRPLSGDTNHRRFRSLSGNRSKSSHRWFRSLSGDSNQRQFRSVK